MKALDWIATIIVALAAINTGIAALFQYDVIFNLIGTIGWLMQAVAVIIGLAGVVVLVLKFSKS